MMIVRRERPDDRGAARAVQAAAFRRGNDEPVEARLLDSLRACDGWIDELSWVVELDDEVVGHCVTTRGHVDGAPVLGLGPIGVRPDVQRDGIGSALVHATIGAADALGEPLIALLGSPAYYARFGFVPSTTVGIAPPDPAWGEHFQVRTLTTHVASTTGTFRYASPFDELE